MAFTALVVAIAANELWPLEFLHVVFGAAWTIIDLFLGLVLGPIIGIAKWALLAYAITAGLIAYAFVRNGVRGGPLVVLTLSLVVYAVHVPMLTGFTVARYDDAWLAGPVTSR